jgi:anthranilate synthase component 2
MAATPIKVLIVDNYDSFTYNIAHAVRSFPGTNLQIIEAGAVDLTLIDLYDKIIFSPGPDVPRTGNIMEKILQKYAGKKSILGICLGLQAIFVYYGGKLLQLQEVVHGRKIRVIKTGIFSKLIADTPDQFDAGLYHSWICDPDHLPSQLVITALSENGRIMGVKHLTDDTEAVQFHPESIMTPLGEKMIHNWLKI